MKNILYILFAVVLMSVSSCMKLDNWDGPDARIYGRIIDSYTNQNIMTSQNEFQIRIYERSYTEGIPQVQTLAVKLDGTYNNSKMFAGTYDMIPYDGPFWPLTGDTTRNVEFTKKGTEQNFTVTPYLQILNFEHRMDGLNLYMSCRVKAPIITGLPNLREVKAFISLHSFCGQASNGYIDIPQYNDRRIQINRTWANEQRANGLDPDDNVSKLYEIGPLPVKSGYTYYIRIGANCTVGNNRYHYSPIVKITIP